MKMTQEQGRAIVYGEDKASEPAPGPQHVDAENLDEDIEEEFLVEPGAA